MTIHAEDHEKTMFTCPFGTYAIQRMPFELCNAPATFQRCMIAIFYNFIGESLEVFMYDFSVFGSSFDTCVEHLTQILDICVKKHLVLSWEKSHFMVREDIVLGHLVSNKGLEVDKTKVNVIQDLALTSSFRTISTGSVGSKVESVSVVSVSVASGVCEDRSKRSISRGLFRTLQAVRLLMKSALGT